MNRRDFTGALGAGLAAWTLPLPRIARQSPPVVNGERLLTSFEGLRRFGGTPAGGTERLAYSDADLGARDYVQGLMRQAGLDVRIDAAGNILGRRAGTDASLPPILIGSHIDSVPDGGNYDGNVGSMGALETAWTIHDKGLRLRHSLEVVIFQNEEGGLVGSAIMSGDLKPGALDQAARSGVTIREGIRRIGGDPDALERARRRSGDLAAYVELHIEQGGVLDESGTDIGVVEGIVGIEWWDVTVEGFANHAGTTPMNKRQDALLAAARFIEAVNRIVTSEPGRQVGTVGQIRAEPGAPNVIPGRVVASLELRDLDRGKVDRLFEEIRTEAEHIGQASGTTFTFANRNLGSIPAPTAEPIRAAIERTAEGLHLSHRRMPSGAGHDAQSFREICPIGMIFVPSRGGISHSPKEYTSPEDVVNGANVLLGTVLALDGADM